MLAPLIRLTTLLVLALCLWQVALWSGELRRARLRADAANTLVLYAFQVRGELNHYRTLAQVLANDGEVIELLQGDFDIGLGRSLNLRLAKLNTVVQAAAIYAMDSRGLTVIASNWDQADSFVGRNFAFRPYFRNALSGTPTPYAALGTTSGERGFYFAYPVHNPTSVVGVMVVKMPVSRLEAPGRWHPDRVALSDPHGVVVVASDPAWVLHTLEPLDPNTLATIRAERQYGDSPLTPLGSPLAEQDEWLITSSNGPRRFLTLSQTLPSNQWTVHVFSDAGPIRSAQLLGLLTGALVAGVLALALAYWRQSRRHRAQERQAHAALEQRVAERTAELREINIQLQQEIGERKRTENELIQAARLAAIGQLSAGVVHEVNQPLTAIRAYAGNALVFLERQRQEEAAANLRIIDELCERIGRLTSRLKGFARKGPERTMAVVLQKTLEQALVLTQPTSERAGVTVASQMPEHPLTVIAEPLRLEQVLVNLLLNAVEAMAGQSTQRCIRLEASETPTQVFLRVWDSGPGLPAENPGRVFEPFYTTKPEEQGLGLGLAISAQIVEEFGGRLEASNHPQGGALFTLTLPRAGDAGTATRTH